MREVCYWLLTGSQGVEIAKLVHELKINISTKFKLLWRAHKVTQTPKLLNIVFEFTNSYMLLCVVVKASIQLTTFLREKFEKSTTVFLIFYVVCSGPAVKLRELSLRYVLNFHPLETKEYL